MSRAMRDLDARHHVHPFVDGRALAASGPRIITRGEGVFVEDDAGRRYLDGMAGLWCVQVGYGRRELIDAATEQLGRLAYYNTFFESTSEPLVELIDVLRTRTPPGLDRFVFANSGSEAIDTAVRLVRHYWAQRGEPNRRVVIGRTLGYHGSTLAGASLGGMPGMHAQGGLPLPDFAHVPPPYPFAYAGDQDPAAYGLQAADALEQKIVELGPDRVAAFVGEPILGAGGVVVPPATYWPRVQEICRRHGVLLLVDEVICGFGRTGRMWGCETFGIEPDAITMAKGLTSGYVPMSAVALSRDIADVLRDAGPLQHGFTYSGHPVAAAVAVANLRVIEREGLIDRVREEAGPHLRDRLDALASHPLVGEVRGCGLLAGLEIVVPGTARERFEPAGRAGIAMRDACLAEGLIVRAIRDGLALCPPLTITRDEIDLVAERLAAALDRAARALA